MMVPVAQELQKRGYELTFLALTTAAPVAKAAGFEQLGFRDFLFLAPPQSIAFGEQLCADQSDGGPVPLAESVAYHGVCFAELVGTYGEEEAKDRYSKYGRQCFLPVEFMETVVNYVEPDIVIATSAPRTERAAIIAAGKSNVSSICMVDLFAISESEWVARPGYSDRVCVLNSAVAERLVANGRDAMEIVVTGNPAFDGINSRTTRENGARLRERMGWGQTEGLTILLASQVEPEVHPVSGETGDPQLPRQIEQKLRRAVARERGLRLVVRYHPSERVEYQAAERVFLSTTSDPLHPLLHAVDLVCTTASTVGLEGWIAGKPVVTVENSVTRPFAPFSEMGIAKGVASPEELAEYVEGLAACPPEFPLPEQREPEEGLGSNSAQGVADVVDKLVATN